MPHTPPGTLLRCLVAAVDEDRLALLPLERVFGAHFTAREIEEQTGRGAAFGTVYATLDRLERKGLVRSDLGDPTPERGGRAKRYFRATAKGLRAVRQARKVLTKLWRGLPELEGEIA